MAEHEHGSMNSDTQQKTFDGFVKFVSRASLVIIGILLFYGRICALNRVSD